jgi:hypothetical protein
MKRCFLFLLPKYSPEQLSAQLERTRQQAEYEIHRCHLELIAAEQENASLVARINARLTAAHATASYTAAALADCTGGFTQPGEKRKLK